LCHPKNLIEEGEQGLRFATLDCQCATFMLEGMNEFSSALHVDMDVKEVGMSIPFLEPKESRLLSCNGVLQGG
jgi:hypothetical protein